MTSTAEDLARFAQALFGGALLRPETLDLMQGYIGASGSLSYGLGLMQDRISPGARADGQPRAAVLGLVRGHTGELIGERTVLWYLPERGITLAVTINLGQRRPQPRGPARATGCSGLSGGLNKDTYATRHHPRHRGHTSRANAAARADRRLLRIVYRAWAGGRRAGPTLQSLADNTNTAFQSISLLFTVRSLGYLLGSFQGGVLYDRFHGHPIVAAVLIGIAGMMILVPLATSIWVLAAIFVVIGVAEGVLDVGGNTLLVWAHGPSVGPYMNGLHFCFGVGAFLGPIIVAQIVTFGGESLWSYWALAALTAPIALVLLRQPSPAARHNVHAEADVGVDYRMVVLIALFLLLYVSAEASFGGWVSSYAEVLRLADEESAAYITSAFWGALTIGRLLSHPAGGASAPAHDPDGRPGRLRAQRRLHRGLAAVDQCAVARRGRAGPGDGVDFPDHALVCGAAHADQPPRSPAGFWWVPASARCRCPG